MRKRTLIVVLAVLLLGAQAPQDYLTHPAVQEALNLRTRVVMLEIAVYEAQDQLAVQAQRIADLEAAVALIDPAFIATELAQLHTQQQVLLTEVKVVETQ